MEGKKTGLLDEHSEKRVRVLQPVTDGMLSCTKDSAIPMELENELSGFNDAQKEAILHKDGPCLVLAGPGSGKTTVITRRLKNMILNCHIPPQGILVVTFTKAAAKEMQLRFETLMGSKMPVSFGTFHAIFFRILREHEKDNPPVLIKEKDKKDLVTGIMRRHRVALKEYSRIAEAFAAIKNGQDPMDEELSEDFTRDQIFLMFGEYRSFCHQNHIVDFDDMAYEVLILFKENKGLLAKWQKRFTYILVDEYQDIAPIQEELLRLLAAPRMNVFVVGDDDQSIYGFRGAGTELMLTFEKRYEGAKTILLDVNYRSRPGIIEAALKVIKENKLRFDKRQNPSREPSGVPAGEVTIRGFRSREEQYTDITEKLRVLASEGKLSRTALLYRKNSDADFAEGVLKKAGIPYDRTKKEQNILNHFITEDITAYLRYVHGDNKRATFYKIMNRPQRGISRDAIRDENKVSLKEIALYHRQQQDVVKAVIKLSEDRKRANKLSIYAAIMYIRKQFGYEEFLKKEYKGSALDENLEALNVLQELAKSCENLNDWEKLINEGELLNGAGRTGKNAAGKEGIISGIQKNASAVDENSQESGVKIMTFHGSKGLEFDFVFLPDINEGTVPHSKTLKEEGIEEERRMFYVAMTRAREELYIMYNEGTRQEPVKPSRFLSPFLGK